MDAKIMSMINSDFDVLLIKKKRRQFLWLILACFVVGGINITLLFISLDIARRERPETTVREVRFQLVEIQSQEYQSYRAVLSAFDLFGKLFLTPAIWFVYFQYLHSLGYSKKRSLCYLLATLFLPIINLILLLYFIHLGGKYIKQSQANVKTEFTE
ncbi:MAG: hypothetical protein LBP59_20615 [Planctomycetaceae bacterium]|jgi:hypothetical protein|nr:hypothetical protein [Planctomycetaceae bacterium]